MTMMWVGIGSAAAGLAGSVYSANKNADAMEDANSGDLPDWLKPYIVGNDPVPSYIGQDPKINTNWLDYIGQLGQGDTSAQWQPMSENSIHFNPDQQFTPTDDGSQFGGLPPGMNQPPPQAPQYSRDEYETERQRLLGNTLISGGDFDYSPNARYSDAGQQQADMEAMRNLMFGKDKTLFRG